MQKKIVVATCIVLVLLIAGYVLLTELGEKAAGLFIETNTVSEVYINDELAGETPFEETLEPGEYDITLKSDGYSLDFKSRIFLATGVRTVIKHSFSDNYSNTSSMILSFSEEAGKNTSIVVATDPTSAEVYIDGEFKGYSPLKTEKVGEGSHVVLLSKPGYLSESVDVTAYPGYRLTLTSKLSSIEEVVELDNTKESKVDLLEKVLILPTGTGFLRVRQDPGVSSVEVGRVVPGESYNLLEVNEETGWYKIEFEGEEGEVLQGYISDEYADLVDIGIDN